MPCACAEPASMSADPDSASAIAFILRMSLLLQLGRRRWWNTGSQLAGSGPNSAAAWTAIGVVSARPDSTASSLSRPVKRSEEHTSELQSLMRISYAVFCLKKKKNIQTLRKPLHHK